ncbi:DUF4215 domain-containing protein, partial [archaeon]|nr:DUF4215 domain-containing protein [archaeon]
MVESGFKKRFILILSVTLIILTFSSFVISQSGNIVCGNNFVDDSETCEDGNTQNNDGCSSSCQTEGEMFGGFEENTPILIHHPNADGQSIEYKSIKNLKVGDKIVGWDVTIGLPRQIYTIEKIYKKTGSYIRLIFGERDNSNNRQLLIGKEQPIYRRPSYNWAAYNYNGYESYFGLSTILSLNKHDDIRDGINLQYYNIDDLDQISSSKILYNLVVSGKNAFFARDALVHGMVSPTGEEDPIESEICGNDVVEGSEDCDNGPDNTNSFSCPYEQTCSYCDLDCDDQTAVGDYCGDGSKQSAYEECDDGNGNNFDGCSNSCVLTYCGDSSVQSPNSEGKYEGCDEGSNNVNSVSCSYDQTCSYCDLSCDDQTVVGDYCGDGTIQINYEECDDGTSNTNDPNCAYNNVCNYCSLLCKTATQNGGTCGDGTTQSNYEECDDGNPYNNDGCSSTCKEEYCGDSIQQNTESCEPSAGINCDQYYNCINCGCILNTVCGNGVLEPNEECDDGPLNIDPEDSIACEYGEECTYCSTNCIIASGISLGCGDGEIQGTEECDDGNSDNNDLCRNDCTYCGDGKIQEWHDEECDDENSLDGDLCSNCLIEEVYFLDLDGDGFGSQNSGYFSFAPESYVNNSLDCDDEDRSRFPRNIEICDNKDNDCNDIVDDILVQETPLCSELNSKIENSGVCKDIRAICDSMSQNFTCNFPDTFISSEEE